MLVRRWNMSLISPGKLFPAPPVGSVWLGPATKSPAATGDQPPRKIAPLGPPPFRQPEGAKKFFPRGFSFGRSQDGGKCPSLALLHLTANHNPNP